MILCIKCRIATDETATSLLSHQQDTIMEEASGTSKTNKSAAESGAPQLPGGANAATPSSIKSPNLVCLQA